MKQLKPLSLEHKIINMYRILIIILVLFTIQASGQGYGYNPKLISLKVMKAVNLLQLEYGFDSEFTGIGGGKSKTYRVFEKIKIKASNSEIIELCKHPSPLVRYYAFYELINRKVDERILLPIIKNHFNDNHKILSFSGCLGKEQSVGTFMFGHISTKYNNDETFKSEIDNHLFYSKGPFINVFETYLEDLPHSEKNYLRLKEMVKEDSNVQALLPLLDYNNPNDWVYIQYILEKSVPVALEAISRFPKATFIPYLEKIKHQTLPFPVQNWETWEWEIKNQQNIIKVYSIFLNMENGVYEEGFDHIFKSDFSTELKIQLSNLIYNKIKDIDEDWTLSVKYNLLPYLDNFENDYLTVLKENDSSKFIEIIRIIPYQNTDSRYYLNFDDAWMSMILDFVIKDQNRADFLYSELNKPINDYFFDFYFEEYQKTSTKNHDEILINRLLLKMNTKPSYINESLHSELKEITKYESKNRLWHLCYQHISNDESNTLVGSYLSLMLYLNREKGIAFALELVAKNNLRTKTTASMLNVLRNLLGPELKKKLLTIYSNQSYNYKTSKIGDYLYKILHMKQYEYSRHEFNWL